MSTIVTIDEAQARLRELVAQLVPGDELVITDNQRTLARLVAAAPTTERQLGTLRGTVLYMAPDFDAPLDEFREYSE